MPNKSLKQAHILKARIDSTSTSSVLRLVRTNISKKKKFYIVTPNPEIALAAENDDKLAKIIDEADISLPDGVGLVAAYKFFQLPNPKARIRRFFTLLAQGLGVGFSIVFNKDWVQDEFSVIKGREMFMELLKLANTKGLRIYFLGGIKGEADAARKALEKNYRKVKIKSFGGPLLNEEGLPVASVDKKREEKAVRQINDFKPHLLFVAASFPRQEKWIYRWYKKLNIIGAMTVGGTFNYVAGRKKLPPSWMDNAGLEWLWRLYKGDQSAKRINNALIGFSFRVFVDKFTR